MPSISLDVKRATKVGSPEGKTTTVKNLGPLTAYYSPAPEAPESFSSELTEGSELTIAPNTAQWFTVKPAGSTEANFGQASTILEVKPQAPYQASTTEIATEAVTAPKLSVVGGCAPGVWGTGERAPRSSTNWPGAGVPAEQAVALAEVGNFVAVPVVPGDIIKTVAVAAGAAATEGVKEFIVGLYAGKTGGELLAQSKSKTPTENHPKKELYATDLESAVTITTTNAPHGYVYAFFAAGVFTTNMTVIGLTYTTANQAILGVYGTAGAAANAIYNKGGAAIKGTAEAVVPTLTAVANIPIVALY